jgi:hypothetical protein
MKHKILFTQILSSSIVLAQKTSTDFFTVTGEVTQEQKFSLNDLLQFPIQAIHDVIITNHKGKYVKNLQVIKCW